MGSKGFWLYQCDPIDWFDGAVRLLDFMSIKNGDLPDFQPQPSLELFWNALRFAARHSWWEGDISDGPYVFFIPTGNCGPDYGFIWKQSNNGTTFVASPIRLPWLDEDEVKQV